MRRTSVVRGLRRNVLWGALLSALVLSLPVPVGAKTVGAKHSHAAVPASLRAAASARPQHMFNVIVQATGDATSTDAARAVRDSARSRVVKQSFSALGSVSASLTGAGLLRLA